MTILIVEDELILVPLLETWARDLGATAVMVATNLKDALELLPNADGVLCDGSFPTCRPPSPESPIAGVRWTPSESRNRTRIPTPVFGGIRENWPHIAGLAEKRGIPFVLFSGSENAVMRARTSGLKAFAKPFDGPAAMAWVVQEVKSRESKVESKAI